MKYKIAALLFSQAAMASATPGTPQWSAETVGASSVSWHIFENNYQGKMCGDDLFVANPSSYEKSMKRGTNPSNSEREHLQSIRIYHEAYCYSKEGYDKAVKKESESGANIPALEREKIKNGIIVATACEKSKQAKKLFSDDFDYYFRKPKACKVSMR